MRAPPSHGARAAAPRMRAGAAGLPPPEGPRAAEAAAARVAMERERRLRAPCAGKAPRKKRRSSPLPGAAALPGSRAGGSQMCRRRLFGSAGPRGPEPASKRLSRAAARPGVQEAGPVPAGKGGGKRTLCCFMRCVLMVKDGGQGNEPKIFTSSVLGGP